MSGTNEGNAATSVEDNYALVAQGYWWNFRQSCICPSGTDFANFEFIECTDDQVTRGCTKIPRSQDRIQMLPIVNKKKYCAFHDSSYTFSDLHMPDKSSLKCTDPKFPKLCGSGKRNRMYCIPQNSNCPLTKVWFENDVLVTSNDPTKGTPLIDINLS